MPDDDMDDMFGDHLADAEWLQRNLMDIVVEDSSDRALIPVLPADDVVGMDICEVCEAVALPDNLARLVLRAPASTNASSASWRWQNPQCAI